MIKQNLLGKLFLYGTGQLKLKNGIKYRVPRDMFFSVSENLDFHERNVDYWLEKITTENHDLVFYDIGANFGYYSVKNAERLVKVYSFEPVSSTLAYLDENIKKNNLKNIKTFKLAISNAEGKDSINIYSSCGNNSIFKRTIPEHINLKLVGKERITKTTLDQIIKNKNLLPPGLLKIDIEGGELMVLRGAKNTLKKYKPIILMEYSDSTCEDAGYRREEILEELKKYGYSIFGLSSDYHDLKLYSEKKFSNKIANIIVVPEGIKI